MRYLGLMLVILCGLFGLSRGASAEVTIQIDLTHQRMYVSADGGDYNWPISSARSGYVTPRGYYRPQRLEAMHYSQKYDNSPMPHSIFFHGGYAIHGTGSVAQLGRPASHGCIRLSRANAATLYALVQEEGARISISGTPPASRLAYRHHHHRTMVASWHHHHHNHALAYAPQHHHNRSLKAWMREPNQLW
ncbi:L,D-transpeptidase [Methylovirgula sp. 4M-Z18]|uniref:L,D-transpeptidase n=1 Tax=Methylovirgula sp. 4M-Z18 TaxID=2293567 RepID=UPI000E2E6AD3|nr:L,D-transpeptidase [Methylovirgula sp. 4M-Z18]RFB75549.1 L,D-transpeptidase [Methylovirgula sp. 4M-Z18]